MTAHRRPDRPEDRRSLRLDPDPLHVPPEPVRRMAPGALDPDAHERRVGVVVPLVLLAVALVLAGIVIVLVAPRGASVPVSPPAAPTLPGASRDALGGSDPARGAPTPAYGWHGESFVPYAPSAPALISGTATWYCLSGSSACTRGYGPDDLVAAIDTDLGFAKGDVVRVRFGDRSVDVRIVDVCGCPGERLIDLTSGAFERLAPLGLGVLPVTVELVAPGLTLPPTDR